MSGWGGEWTDIAWGTGTDYPYDPEVFLDAEGRNGSYTAHNAALAYTARSPLVSFARAGTYAGSMAAIGRRLTYTTTGVRTAYTATGVLEDGD